MTDRPAPLTPSQANLTDFAFMPLEVARLRKSKAWLICKRRPELGFYLVNLWTAAWHETPAGSLEDDDDVLADRAMCSPEKWPDVKTDLLRGWVTCADGRLYHPVVAEKVIDAWRSKREHAYGKERERLAKALKRSGVKKVTDEMLPSYDLWDQTEMSGGQFSVVGGQVTVSDGRPKDTYICPPDKGVKNPVCPPENALKGEGEGEGQGEGYIYGAHDVSGGQAGDNCPADNSGEKGRYPSQPARRVELNEAEHHARFERLMAKYPKFSGVPNLILVERTCRQLVDDGDETWDTLDSHAERFEKFVRAGGRSGPQYVDNPLKFFSTESLRRGPWDPPDATPASKPETPLEREWRLLRAEAATGGFHRDPKPNETPDDYRAAMKAHEREQQSKAMATLTAMAANMVSR